MLYKSSPDDQVAEAKLMSCNMTELGSIPFTKPGIKWWWWWWLWWP